MKFGTLIFLTTAIPFGVPPIPVRLAAQNASSEIINFDAPAAGKTAGAGQLLARACVPRRAIVCRRVIGRALGQCQASGPKSASAFRR